MITVCQGTPGSGKSAVAVAKAIAHLKKGGVVAANFQLVDGWADVVAKTMLSSRLSSERHYTNACSLYQRFSYVDSLNAISAIDPRAMSDWLYRDNGDYSEGNGLLILDEAQLVFNSRKWEKNFSWIEFFTQHRKLGWNVFLIAHSIEMIDSQIRPLCEYAATFRNMQKVRVPIVGSPFVPYPVFLVITRYAGLGAGAGAVHSREAVPLPLWAARLYDSLLVFSAERWREETFPQSCGSPPSPGTHEGFLDHVKRFFEPPPRSRVSTNSCLWSQWDSVHSPDPVIELCEVYNDALWPVTFRLP